MEKKTKTSRNCNSDTIDGLWWISAGFRPSTAPAKGEIPCARWIPYGKEGRKKGGGFRQSDPSGRGGKIIRVHGEQIPA